MKAYILKNLFSMGNYVLNWSFVNTAMNYHFPPNKKNNIVLMDRETFSDGQ